MKRFVSVILLLFPWKIRRWLLGVFFGYKIHPTARIGLSIICPDRLEMSEYSRIGNLTVCKRINLLKLSENAIIGNLNWITGLPLDNKKFLGDEPDRRPELIVDAHASITNRHWVDCTNAVHVGKFSVVAGLRSQLVTHSINLEQSMQGARPIRIGEYCFVGTGCILLGGSVLPDYSVLGAGSLLNKAYTEKHYLYGGVPARAVKALTNDLGYFLRKTGFIT
jgi:acetyltransferase-like isoleucine patch superfamily enzyme